MQSFKAIMGLNASMLSVGDGGLTEINFTTTLRDYYNNLELHAQNYDTLMMKLLSGGSLTTEELTSIGVEGEGYINTIKAAIHSGYTITGPSVVTGLNNFQDSNDSNIFNNIDTFTKILEYQLPSLAVELTKSTVKKYIQNYAIVINYSAVAYDTNVTETLAGSFTIDLSDTVVDINNDSSINELSTSVKTVTDAGTIDADIQVTVDTSNRKLLIEAKSSIPDQNGWRVEEVEDLDADNVASPSPRSGHSQAIVGDTLYIIGGVDHTLENWAYDLINKTWERKVDLPEDINSTVCIKEANNTLFASISPTDHLIVYVYSVTDDYWYLVTDYNNSSSDGSSRTPATYYNITTKTLYFQRYEDGNAYTRNDLTVEISFNDNGYDFIEYDLTGSSNGQHIIAGNMISSSGAYKNVHYNGRRIGFTTSNMFYDQNGNNELPIDFISSSTKMLVHNDFVYIYQPQTTYGGNLWRYNPESQSLDEATHEAIDRYDSGFSLWHGRAYAFGGKLDVNDDGTPTDITNKMDSYLIDIGTNQAMVFDINITNNITPQLLELK